MAVSCIVDNEQAVFVMHFSGVVTKSRIFEVIDQIAENVSHEGTYRSLLIFDSNADLSELDAEALKAIHRESAAMYHRLNLQRSVSAAMVDDSHDAKVIVPLYNAICQATSEPEFGFEMFTELEPALERLDLSTEAGKSLTLRTAAA